MPWGDGDGGAEATVVDAAAVEPGKAKAKKQQRGKVTCGKWLRTHPKLASGLGVSFGVAVCGGCQCFPTLRVCLWLLPGAP